MQKKPTPQSRSANASEKRFHAWCKEQPSIVSGQHGVEVHHCSGSSSKSYVGAERVHIGHWFCLPLTTQEHWLFHNRKNEFITKYGMQNELWLQLIDGYDSEIPHEVMEAIVHYGK
jgi:hypothetical protein